MSKKIVSPVARYPGHVLLHDPLSLPMVVALEAAIAQGRDVGGAAGELALLPGLLACVQSAHIDGLAEHPTPDDWPGTPRKAAFELIRWLTAEVMAVYVGELQIPNA